MKVRMTNVNRRKAALALLALLLIAALGSSLRGWAVNQNGSATAARTNNSGVTSLAPAGATSDGKNAGSGTSQTRSTSTTIGQSVKNDVSPALRTMRPLREAPQKQSNEGPENLGLDLSKQQGKIVDTALQTRMGNAQMPTPIANFEGTAFHGSFPADPNGDVGPNHYVQWVNTQFQIFTKTGVSVYGPADGNTLWTGFGGPCETRNDGDPIVQYDPLAQRWLLSQFNIPGGPTGFYQCIAISQTSDPTSSYYRYAFLMSTTLMNDYPKFGVWPDAYYMSIVNFQGDTYVGPSAVAFDRARMLAGQPATFQRFDLPDSYLPILPADLDGNRPPPAGAPNTFVTIQPPNVVQLWKFSVNWSNPASSAFTGPANLVVAPYDVRLCDLLRSCINQPVSGRWLDGNVDRPMYRLAYRNLGSHESLVFNHTVATAEVNGQAAPRWYEIRNASGNPTLHQQGTFGPNDQTERWMGSIAMDAVGNIALGYSVSSDTVYPGIRYTGRLLNDPLGTMPQGEGVIVNGGGAQLSTNRWGDYTMMSVDPVDDCTFWYTNQYYSTTSSYSWRTRIASFKFPNCTKFGTTTPTATATSTSTPTNTRTPTATRTPSMADAYSQLQPGGQVTVTLGSKLVFDLKVNAGTNNVVAAQQYLTFTHSMLQSVEVGGTGCALANALQPDSAVFDTVLQNQICNGGVPCNFGGMTVPAGSISFASAAISHAHGTGTFRVARVAFCANTVGTARVRWQLPPSAPADRQSEISNVAGDNVSNPALYSDLIINVVGGTATPVATSTSTSTQVPSSTATSTSTSTSTATNTRTATATVTNTAVSTATSTSTNTSTRTSTATATATSTNTATNTIVPSSTPTNTVVPSSTRTNTVVPSSTSTNTTVPTNTSTATSTHTATATSTSAASPTATCVVNPNYQVAVSTGATMVPATNRVSESNCNNCVVNITLPFTYTLYDTPYTSLFASNKGTLQFDNPTDPGDNTCLPAANLGDTIFAYWDSMNSNVNDNMGIFTSTTGVAPNRIFTIRWSTGSVANDRRSDFQVNLYEGQPKFEIIYEQALRRGHSATVGVQKGANPSRFTQFECNTPNTIQPGMKLVFDMRTCPGVQPAKP